jgi:hypothetical protein
MMTMMMTSDVMAMSSGWRHVMIFFPLVAGYQPADVVPSQAQDLLPTVVNDTEALLQPRVAQE